MKIMIRNATDMSKYKVLESEHLSISSFHFDRENEILRKWCDENLEEYGGYTTTHIDQVHGKLLINIDAYGGNVDFFEEVVKKIEEFIEYRLLKKYEVKGYRSSDGWLHDNITHFLVSEYVIIKDKFLSCDTIESKDKFLLDNKYIIEESEKIFKQASPSFISTLK